MRRGTALVTGSSGGFGRRIAVELAKRGFQVFASMRDRSRSGPLEAALATAGFDAEIVVLDVTNAEDQQRVVRDIEKRAGAVDVLVNNAGAMLTGFVEDLSDAELRAQFEVNFFGLVALTRACIGSMRERRHGRIINVSSIGGRVALPGHGAYNASKFALEGISESLRYELYPYNVFVSLVEPGLFRTELFGRNTWHAERSLDPNSPHRKATDRLRDNTRLLLEHYGGSDPNRVARVVAKIALARRPRLRYPVGIDAWWTTAVAPWMPSWWQAYMASVERSQ